ncbi:MAG: serine/threonine-protein kinase [Pirellulaceae bacterium]
MPTSKSVFRNSALLSGLVTQEQIDDALARLHVSAGADGLAVVKIDDPELAAQLVADGLLTTYQAEQLKNGRTKLNLGPYIVTDFIGQGGMGHVFKAEHEMLGRESAIKVLPLHKSTDDAKQNFRREIRTQAQLDHANLVRAYDAGEDGNVYYLVVEYVPGTDLRRLVRSQKRLTMQQAASIVMQASHGLEYAHRRGLIHRDVKPGNILVTPEGIAKVSDLGLAGFVHEAEHDPRAGKIVGTADYLAPEQIRTPNDITKASDVYSLGCTLYYAVTGKVPFPGGTAGNKAARHCEETPWHPRRFNPELSEEFVEIIADMMEKDPRARINSMAEVAARLEAWASDAGPIPSHHLGKSPWLPPPLPIEENGDEELRDTGSASFDFGDFSHATESPSQSMQRTGAMASAGQETTRMGGGSEVRFEPVEGLSRATCVAIALAITIPITLFVGLLIGAGLSQLIW